MNATKNKKNMTGPVPFHGVTGKIYGFLASLKFTILLFSLIATGSVFGTAIRQRVSLEEYLSAYSEHTVRLIKFFGLDDVYHSTWFYSLLVLFLINLILCTVQRLSRFMKIMRSELVLPDEKSLSAMELSFVIETERSRDMEQWIDKSYRRVMSSAKEMVYEKGILSRYGVFTIHLSIVFILLGGFADTMLGYKGYMVLTKGEAKDRIVTRGENTVERTFNFTLKCKNFKVAFYPGGEPKDYVSTVEVIENGKIVMEKDVRVNDPLNYKGIRVYQSSYGRAPSFLFNISGENVILKERETFSKDQLFLMVVRFESQIHGLGPGVLIGYLDKGEPKTAWFFKNAGRMQERNLNGVDIRLENIAEEFYTGLEVSKDPGVWIVWTGFVLMLFGLYVNFFTYYRQIFMRRRATDIIVAGFAPKGKEAFREEFARLKAMADGSES
ncbi:MAG: cytochrome c biogenesis protein ResB [Syntrophobacterales bacterium]|jgi:cytochrome c biogenesis protein|nr:cytochrome c biogenesis protein ResB [Syntrophobacterales bacterium]